jgi:hypothetical protein
LSDHIVVVVVEDGFHFEAKLGAHFGACIRFCGGFEGADSEHIRLDAEHFEEVAVEGDFGAESGEREGTGFGHEDAVTSGGEEVLEVAGIIEASPDGFAGGFDGSDSLLEFVEACPSDIEGLDFEDDAGDGFVIGGFAESIEDGGQ